MQRTLQLRSTCKIYTLCKTDSLQLATVGPIAHFKVHATLSSLAAFNAIQLVKCTFEKHCGAYSHKTDMILLINNKAAMAKHVQQS